ncbi:1644_t:CDS:2 [Paraglomus occultum]|uniref:1644_t:CDS:1 n=1 Tax=Paraglomus occultum TaxID=144539 RepID=A0A9N8WF56_9GLOM|nr:1644_t:CDS:2 [Paraglomus occultum]
MPRKSLNRQSAPLQALGSKFGSREEENVRDEDNENKADENSGLGVRPCVGSNPTSSSKKSLRANSLPTRSPRATARTNLRGLSRGPGL